MQLECFFGQPNAFPVKVGFLIFEDGGSHKSVQNFGFSSAGRVVEAQAISQNLYFFDFGLRDVVLGDRPPLLRRVRRRALRYYSSLRCGVAAAIPVAGGSIERIVAGNTQAITYFKISHLNLQIWPATIPTLLPSSLARMPLRIGSRIG